MNAVNNEERDKMKEFDALVQTMQNAVRKYSNSTYVQKRKMIELMFSNIVVDKQKRLTFEANP